MLRGPIRVLLGLVDRAARAWVRWRAGRRTQRIRGRWTDAELAAPCGLGGAGASRRPRPARARRRRSHADRTSRPGFSSERDGRAPRPATDRSCRRSEARLSLCGPEASGHSATLALRGTASAPTSGQEAGRRRFRSAARVRGEGVGPPAADVLLPGRPHSSPAASTRARERNSARTLGDAPSRRAPSSPGLHGAPGRRLRRRSFHRRRPNRSVPYSPFRRRSPLQSRPKPRQGRSIGRNLQPVNLPAAPKRERPSERLAEERSDSDSHSWPALPDPPEEAGTDVEVALRKMERDRQVAREHSRL